MQTRYNYAKSLYLYFISKNQTNLKGAWVWREEVEVLPKSLNCETRIPLIKLLNLLSCMVHAKYVGSITVFFLASVCQFVS